MDPSNSHMVQGRDWAPLLIWAATLLNLIAIGVWDGWCMWTGHPEDTVTDIFQAWARRVPLVVFVMGFVICHLIGLGASAVEQARNGKAHPPQEQRPH